MAGLLLWIGRLAGLAGVVVCAVSVAIRLSGEFYLGGFAVGQIFQIGIAAMLVGCLGFLWALAERQGL